MEFCVSSSFRREIEVNQYSLCHSLEERISQKRGLCLQAFVVETEKCVTEKQAFAKRSTQFNNIAIKIEQSDVIRSNTRIFQYSSY